MSLMASWDFASVFETVAEVFPDRTAVVHGEEEVSWSSLDRGASGLAATLLEAGLRPGDVVAEYMRNGPPYLLAFFAISKTAMAPMNTNYRYVDDELVQSWADAPARAVIYDAEFRDRVERVRERLAEVRLWIEVGGTDTPTWATSYAAALAHRPAPRGGGAEDALILIYTGGTTGQPKGVMWRQGDILSLLNSQNARPLPDHGDQTSVADHLRQNSRPARFLAAGPLMHGAGLFYAIAALAAGGTIVTVPGSSFSAERLLDTVARRRVNSMAIIGDAFARPLVAALDAEPDRWGLGSLRFVFSSGVMWSREVKEGLLRHARRARLLDGLGSSEASAVAATISTAGDVADTATFRPSDRTAILLDDGTLARPGDGQVGRLAVTGWIPVGYLNDPERSARTFIEVDGRRWSVPGDLAQLDEHGHIRLLGRDSGVINTGGEKVFAEEVEEVLKLHPDVNDAAVLGIPDERLGAQVVALVEVHGEAPPVERLTEHARRYLAGYKVPRRIGYVESVERGVNGKLDHPRLVQRAKQKWSNA
jgi:fatty-acyl-CoA synthase